MGFFDFFFGSSQKIEQQKQPQIQEEQNWIYDMIYEHLTSPIWKITISDFMDQNCIIFDEGEENKLEYQQKFKEFKHFMSLQFDNMILDLKISEIDLANQIKKGLQNPQHKQIFEQILVIDNFEIFKKQMIKRNKELELEAIQELQKQEQGQNNYNNNFDNVYDQNFELQRIQIEKEKAELELAIQLSKEIEEERKKLLNNSEDNEMKRIIKESLEEYNQMITQLNQIQQKEEELKQQPQYKNSQLLKSIKQMQYPTFSSYQQKYCNILKPNDNKQQNSIQKQEQQDESEIIKVEERVDHQFQNIYIPNKNEENNNLIPPIINKVDSDILEESQKQPSDHLQEKAQQLLQQKNKLNMLKSEMSRLKLQQYNKEKEIQKSVY